MRIFVLWSLIVCGTASAEEITKKAIQNWWPSCIAQFCFGTLAPAESELTRKYGIDEVENQYADFSHCFVLPDQGLFLRFSVHHDHPPIIDGIAVGDRPLCEKLGTRVYRINAAGTAEGLNVGDAYEKILQLYGEPNYVKVGKELKSLIRIELREVDSYGDIDKALAYGPNEPDSLFTAWMFLSKNKLSIMLITISE